MWPRGLLRARSRFPEIVENIEKRRQRMECLECPNALAKQVHSMSHLSISANTRTLLKFRIRARCHGYVFHPQLPRSGLLARRDKRLSCTCLRRGPPLDVLGDTVWNPQLVGYRFKVESANIVAYLNSTHKSAPRLTFHELHGFPPAVQCESTAIPTGPT